MLPVGIPSLQPDDIERTTVTGLETNIHAILPFLLANFETSPAERDVLASIRYTDDFFAWKGTVGIQETFKVEFQGRDGSIYTGAMPFPEEAVCIMLYYYGSFYSIKFSAEKFLQMLGHSDMSSHTAHCKDSVELLEAWITDGQNTQDP
eukprot:GHVS01056222.1.p1 GENE.GHVS01056222.1~~GHVS01056222.1.p1  ORF type:complete len:149 (+),score=13.32 GHVS01056222.1:3-449(+)